MTVSGHVYRITNVATCFFPMLESEEDNPPESGFEPWAGAQVTLILMANVGGLLAPIYVAEDLGPEARRTVNTADDGSFSFADPSAEQLSRIEAWAGRPGNEALSVFVQVSSRTFPFQVVYRSDMSLTLADADATEIDVWLYPYQLSSADGVAAGTISEVMSGSDLPGNTSITASPSGLAFSGWSRTGLDIKFGIGILPDTSSDLSSFFDLSLLSWHINVSFPADTCTSADDILHKIRSGTQGAGASMSKKAHEFILNIIQDKFPIFTSDHIKNFIDNDTSITFINLQFTDHTWPAGDKKDDTIVFTAEPVIGWPRTLRRDPRNTPVNAPPTNLALSQLNIASVHPIFGLTPP